MTELSERARKAHILCAITFHFDTTHLGFLAEVLRSLCAFPVAAMDVVVVTNTLREQDQTSLRGLCVDMPSANLTSPIRPCISRFSQIK